MKKLIFLSLLCLGLVSCDPVEPSKNPAKELKYVMSRGQYNGHQYLIYKPGSYTAGIVHDPDCPCDSVK